MLVKTDTGTYDDAAIYTAHDLAADHWWAESYQVSAVGGRVLWQNVEYADGKLGIVKNVRIWRLEAGTGGMKLLKQYIAPETPMRLVRAPWAKAQQEARCDDCL